MSDNDMAVTVFGKRLEKIRDTIKKKLLPLLEGKNKEAIITLEKDLDDLHQRECLTITVIGAYNAGKSTLISALTGRRDLKISADIATDECREYEWNGIRLIDTPGLGTERQDHDERTYEAIKKADLLVYCLTYSLFDTLTLENFKKLAFDQNYQTKMMLLVNKMSAEAGDVEERIGYYTESLKKSLELDDLSQFPLVFCDAHDQLKGEDEQDEELKKFSRFEFLTQELNKFVKERNIIARLQTPLDMIIRCLNDVVESHSDNLDDQEQKLIISTMDSSVKNSEIDLENKLREIILKFENSANEKGQTFIRDYNLYQEDMEAGDKFDKLQTNVYSEAEKARCEIKGALNEAYNELVKITEQKLSNPLIENLKPSKDVFCDREKLHTNKSSIKALKLLNEVGNVVNKFDPNSLKLLKPLVNEQIGKQINGIIKKYKPVQEVIDIVSPIVEEMYEKEKEKENRKCKQDLRNFFKNDIVSFYKKQLEEFSFEARKKIYGQARDYVAKSRKCWEEQRDSRSEVRNLAIALRDKSKALSKSLLNKEY